MNEFLLVLTGAGISLVSSTAVTWLQARHLRRTELRASARDSTRQLTAMFIAERDSPADASGKKPSPNLAEAEVLSAALADRRTRERIRTLIRLLREVRLPELQELSGVKAERGREMLCDHALEVLGAHFRTERTPALPQSVQKMLDVEDEALNIHAGGTSKSVTASTQDSAAASSADSGAGSSAESASTSSTSSASASSTTTRKPRRKPRVTQGGDSKSATKKEDEVDETIENSSFWKD